jgi:hypothetical protein
MIYEWSVNQTASPSAIELQEALNALERQGYEIQSIFAIGHSVMVVARRRLQATASLVTLARDTRRPPRGATPPPGGDETED